MKKTGFWRVFVVLFLALGTSDREHSRAALYKGYLCQGERFINRNANSIALWFSIKTCVFALKRKSIELGGLTHDFIWR